MQNLGLTSEIKKEMQVFKNISLLLSVLLLFTGCAIKRETVFSHPYKIVVKTRTIGIADAGFLRTSEGYKNLQIFSAGTLVFNLELSNNACLNGRCTTREDFNTKLFGYPYYEHIMDDVLSQKKIFNGENVTAIKNGFEQTVKSRHYDIFYKVDGKNIYFRDKVNNVLIKLERI